jgi:hypothetical protein
MRTYLRCSILQFSVYLHSIHVQIIQEVGKGAYFMAEDYDRPYAVSSCTRVAQVYSNRMAKEDAHPRFYADCERARALRINGLQVAADGSASGEFIIPKSVVGMRLAVRGLLTDIACECFLSRFFVDFNKICNIDKTSGVRHFPWSRYEHWNYELEGLDKELDTGAERVPVKVKDPNKLAPIVLRHILEKIQEKRLRLIKKQ